MKLHNPALVAPRSVSKVEGDRKSLLVLHDDIAGLKSKHDADKKLDPPILAAINFLIDSIGVKFGKRHRIHYLYRNRESKTAQQTNHNFRNLPAMPKSLRDMEALRAKFRQVEMLWGTQS